MEKVLALVFGIAIGAAVESRVKYLTKYRTPIVIDSDPDSSPKLDFNDMTLVGSGYGRR